MGFADLKEKAMNMDSLVGAGNKEIKKESYGGEIIWVLQT